jgi:hypothetical protein
VNEPTDEMIYAFAGEPEITATDAHAIRVGLAAVLAIVERDQAAQRRRLADALEAVQRAIATDSRDWGKGRGDAWLWGVLVGWECDERHEHEDDCGGALDELAIRHGWTAAHVERIRTLRTAIREAAAS